MFPDAFLITSIKPTPTSTAPNAYTGRADSRSGAWRVRLMDGFMPEFHLDAFYETLDAASRFSPFQILQPAQVIAQAGASHPFTVGSIDRVHEKQPPNFWTGKAGIRRASVVKMYAATGPMQGLDLSFPVQSDALQFHVGRSYTLLDVLGTWPAAPFNVAAKLAELAQQARQAQQGSTGSRRPASGGRGPGPVGGTEPLPGGEIGAGERQGGQGDTGLPGGGVGGSEVITPAQAKADIVRALGYAEQDYAVGGNYAQYKADINAAVNQQSAALLQAANADFNALIARLQADLTSYASAFRPPGAPQIMPPGARIWFITNGGATGFYDGVFYTLGRFTPAIGTTDYQWFGVFSRDGTNPAPPAYYSD